MKYNIDNLTKKIQKSKKRTKVISFFIYSILTIYLIINIIMVVQTTINPEKVPSILGYKSFSIITRKYGTNYKY